MRAGDISIYFLGSFPGLFLKLVVLYRKEERGRIVHICISTIYYVVCIYVVVSR